MWKTSQAAVFASLIRFGNGYVNDLPWSVSGSLLSKQSSRFDRFGRFVACTCSVPLGPRLALTPLPMCLQIYHGLQQMRPSINRQTIDTCHHRERYSGTLGLYVGKAKVSSATPW